MEKLLTVVFVSCLLLLATLGDDASARSSLHSSLAARRGHALGRKGGDERGLLGRYHYRREGKLKEQHEVAAMEVKTPAERKDGGTDEEDEDAAGTEGLISSADYSGVAMHDRGSPPAHRNKKHPKP